MGYAQILRGVCADFAHRSWQSTRCIHCLSCRLFHGDAACVQSAPQLQGLQDGPQPRGETFRTTLQAARCLENKRRCARCGGLQANKAPPLRQALAQPAASLTLSCNGSLGQCALTCRLIGARGDVCLKFFGVLCQALYLRLKFSGPRQKLIVRA
jgi:hypothetical protein